MSSTRRGVQQIIGAAAAVLALAACSSGASSGTGSSTSSSTSAPAAPTSAASAAPSVTGSVAVPSVDTQQLSAIATCLKNAGLPTPTSTDVAQAIPELVRLVRDPRTVAALKACGVPIPGLGGTTS